MATATMTDVEDARFQRGSTIFDDLLRSIGYAESCTELEGWLAQASRAALGGALSLGQLEDLVDRAIEVSRSMPEN